jgi:hypothetical protein
MTKKRTSLVENINRRKRAGKSRSKTKATVSPIAYREMQQGSPGRKQKTAKKSNAEGKRATTKTRAAKENHPKEPIGARRSALRFER